MVAALVAAPGYEPETRVPGHLGDGRCRRRRPVSAGSDADHRDAAADVVAVGVVVAARQFPVVVRHQRLVFR